MPQKRRHKKKKDTRRLTYFLLSVGAIAVFAAIALVLAFSIRNPFDPLHTAKPELPVETNSDLFLWDGDIITGLTDTGIDKTELSIPARCKGFSDNVFENSKVQYVSFEGSEHIELGEVFRDSLELVKVSLPQNQRSIPANAFRDCPQLVQIEIPATVTDIGDNAFCWCKSLREVAFRGAGIAQIPANCFERCDALVEINLPAGVERIGKGAFKQCGKLSDISLPDTLKEIGADAFAETAIEQLNIPKEAELTSISDHAFGEAVGNVTASIFKGSWCDSHRAAWDIGFKEVIYADNSTE